MTIDKASDTVSGQFSFTVSKAIWAKMPSADKKLFTKSFSKNIKITPLTKKNYIGYKYVLTKTPIAELSKNDAKANLPFYLTKTAKGYSLDGDFSKTLLTPAQLKKKGVTLSSPLPKPNIKLNFTFPNPVLAGTNMKLVKVNKLSLDSDFIVANPTFHYTTDSAKAADLNKPKTGSPESFGTLPKSSTPAFPLNNPQRSLYPLYFFSFLLIGGMGAMFYGWFGNVAWLRDAEGASKKKVKKKKTKTPKKKK